MASSKVMASASPPNPDLPRQPSSSIHHHHHSSSVSTSQHHHHYQHHHQQQQQQQFLFNSSNDQSRGFGSMNMEEILKNIYSDSDQFPSGGAGGAAEEGSVKGKTVDEVWREIVNGGGGGGNREPEMTLEDFLTKAGAVAEEDVRVPVAAGQQPQSVATAGFGVETMMNSGVQFQPGMQHMQNISHGGFGTEGAPLGFGNGMVAVGGRSGGVAGGSRGKRRAVETVPLDKATQQKQRRMIKNRESAARSRERKQAYTVELESLVTQLEDENARLVREEAERNKQRYKQLMENLIPVLEKRRPRRVLRRVNSMSW